MSEDKTEPSAIKQLADRMTHNARLEIALIEMIELYESGYRNETYPVPKWIKGLVR